MKKKLLIVIPIIVIVLAAIILLPAINNKKNKQIRMNSPIVDKQVLSSSYDEVINKYQMALDYPYNMIAILNLGVFDMEGCLSDYNQDNGYCTVQYAYHDLNNDGIDELIIANDIYDTILIVDIYYYDGSSVKSLLGGFWFRNNVTLYENGKFIVNGADGASRGTDSYYGNVVSIKEKDDNWNNFGLVAKYEYDLDLGMHTYKKYDKNHNEKLISEKEFNKISEEFNNKVKYDDWEWHKLTENPDVKVDDKYKVSDYFYLVDKDIFVKGKMVTGDYTNSREMKSDLRILYPKLYDVVDKIAYNFSRCVQGSAMTNGQYQCEVDTSSYLYPQKYQYPPEGKSDKAGLTEFFFKQANIYYDTDGDGYVDSKATDAVIVAPIDEYDQKYGKLID